MSETRNLDSVFADCTEAELGFEAMFDEDDSIIDHIAGVDEAGVPLTGPDFDWDSLTEADDARSRKIYEDDTEDDYLDYDMFDFIYGLVTDCWPKPLNPLNHRLRKFMYAGSDDYLKTNKRDYKYTLYNITSLFIKF